MLARLIYHISEGPAIVDDDAVPGSVLCFLPGWAEIRNCQEQLEHLDHRTEKLWVLPLHSTLPKADQELIFKRPPAGKMKVILGTNIAESSVTIDDVVVVIDSGLIREVSYDPVRHLSVLETCWVSQSSAIQRMGRAGRVRKGKVYRFFSRVQLEQAPWRTTPEMQRVELTSTCLQALALRREARDFLGRAPDPPSHAAVETALEELLQLGALCLPEGERTEASEVDGMRERMMPLGDALSRMTPSPKLSRMLITSTLFGAVDVACMLAAVIAAPRRVFVSPPGKRKESVACVRGFSATSDVLAAYEACKGYEGWKMARGEAYASRWASDLFLVPKRLSGLLQTRDMYFEELQRAGLVTYADRRGLWGSLPPSAAAWKSPSAWEGNEEAQEAWGDDEGAAAASAAAAVDMETASTAASTMEADDGGMSELVKAFLVAAYPESVALRRRLGMAKHHTPTGLEAIIAPQSVNAPPKINKASIAAAKEGGPGEGRMASWWSYGQMHISNRQGFLRSTTLIDPYHVALFGGLTTTVDDQGALREVDGWIELRGQRSTLRTMAKLRECMTRCIHLRALEPFAALPKGVRAVLSEVGGLLKTATPRQERVAARLPENFAQPVEKPPPPSEWKPPARREKGKGKSGGWERGSQWNGRADTWDAADGWSGEAGWSASRSSKGAAKGKDSKGGRNGKGSSGGDSWDSRSSWWAEGWDEGWAEESSWSRGASRGKGKGGEKGDSKGNGKSGDSKGNGKAGDSAGNGKSADAKGNGKSKSSGSTWKPVSAASEDPAATNAADAGAEPAARSKLRADVAAFQPGVGSQIWGEGSADASVWPASSAWAGQEGEAWVQAQQQSWSGGQWDVSWDLPQGGQPQMLPAGHDDTRLVPG